MTYNHKDIEKKWQKYWEEKEIFKTYNPGDKEFDGTKPKYYVLDMFPYPSGAGLHVGHPKGYTANDIIARYKKANGYNVLHPMGWDAFGLPAENYAIKTGTHPKITTEKNIDNFRKQIKSIGFSYDWSREINTTDPKYYKWTQWIFLKMFENGLAYEQNLPINYCPSCKTGLANEEVLKDGICDRCGTKVEKRPIRQWVLAITKYADRLEKDVDKLDWPEGIKEMQKSWIGKSEGTQFKMDVIRRNDKIGEIEVYTTRIDTVFGMSYAVIAPDHKDVEKIITEEQKEICEKYIQEAKNKSDLDRTADNKEKTGVWTGSYVINPYNGEKLPLWISDYVLGHYGTGAVMAVPAHDERDFAFAKKYNLPIKQSIAKDFEYTGIDAPRKGIETLNRKTVDMIIENKKGEILLEVEDHSNGKHIHFVGGGIEKGQTEMDAVKAEIIEETGYTDFEIIGPVNLSYANSFGYRANKNKNQQCLGRVFYVKLKGDNQIKSEIDEGKHKIMWIEKSKVLDLITWDGHKDFWNNFLKEKPFTEYGILVNSGDFDGLSSKEAKKILTEYAEKKGFGFKKINYKLRDWIFSRQRYWGEPIPLIHLSIEDIKKLPHISDLSEVRDLNKAYILKRLEKEGENILENAKCPHTGMVRELVIGGKVFSKIYDGVEGKIVCDYNLPLELPEVEKYEPAGDGQSPLANVESFVNIKLADNLIGKRETNTMPQWGGSCWYYLRYMDVNNDKELVHPDIEKYWNQVDSYVGGTEHAVLHLLYARFWHKFLYDIKVVSTDEPFYRLRNQGLILSHAFEKKNGGLVAVDLVEEKDGKYFHKETGEELNKVVAKMSKSLKNVVNPDDIINEYGADALRLYEMYLSDFKDSAPWDTKGIVGIVRFLDKVSKYFIENNLKLAENDDEAIRLLHKSIKKISQDIENYKFNTAIAQLMILLNYGIPKDEKIGNDWKLNFIKLLYPFAPHITEEIYQNYLDIENKKDSIFFESWPEFDEKLAEDDLINIAVQVMGKLRGTIKIKKDASKEEVLNMAKNDENVKKWIEGKNIVKEIYVPGKIVNLVVK